MFLNLGFKLMKGSWRPSKGLSIALIAAYPVATQAQEILYRETFSYCSASLGAPAATQTNWSAFPSGIRAAKIGNLKVFSYGSRDIGNAVNSNPIGLAQGYAFWAPATYGLTIFTEEFAAPVESLQKVEYLQRLSGVNASNVNNSTRVALLIGDTWYISSRSVSQVDYGEYESASFDLQNETFGTSLNIPGVGPAIPANYSPGVPLPTSGTVSALGIFIDEVNGRVRIDNYVVTGTAFPGLSTAAQSPNTASCPPDSPDITGIPGDLPPPPEDDEGTDTGSGSGGGGSSVTPDREIPSEPAPPQLKNQFIFCPSTQEGAGSTVRIAPKARAPLTKLAAQPGAADLRDAAIFSILSSRPLPTGALVNVKLSDYDPNTGQLSLVLRKGAAPRVIPLSAKAKGAMATYLSQVRGGFPATAPLFVAIDAKVKSANVSQAACNAELMRMIRSRARKAKVDKLVSFINRPTKKGSAARR